MNAKLLNTHYITRIILLHMYTSYLIKSKKPLIVKGRILTFKLAIVIYPFSLLYIIHGINMPQFIPSNIHVQLDCFHFLTIASSVNLSIILHILTKECIFGVKKVCSG